MIKRITEALPHPVDAPFKANFIDWLITNVGPCGHHWQAHFDGMRYAVWFSSAEHAQQFASEWQAKRAA